MNFTEEELQIIWDVIDLAWDHDFYGGHPEEANIIKSFEIIISKIKEEGLV